MEVVALMIFTTTTLIQRVKTDRVLQRHQTPSQRSERVKGLAGETMLDIGKWGYLLLNIEYWDEISYFLLSNTYFFLSNVKLHF